MKKSGLILRLGLVALITTGLSTISLAQNAKKPGRKDAAVKVAAPATQVKAQSQTVNGVAQPTLNPKLASQKRGAVAAIPGGTGGRKCTPIAKAKPYSITRANFNKLPESRQEFVLQHADKYTIVD